MENRMLGKTGLRVSPICLGTMNFGGPTDDDEAGRIVDMALDAGVNIIDTADVYHGGESERVVGQLLKKSGRRDSVLLATKLFRPTGPLPNDQGASRHHIVRACEASLNRLQTDHIDLYQLHRPSPYVPQEETLRAFEDLIRAGKVRYIGSSTHPAWLVMESLAIAERYGWNGYVTEQPPYNLLDRRIENELVPLALKYNIALLPWSPVGGGLLAGRYQPGKEPPSDSRAAVGHPNFRKRLTKRATEVAVSFTRIAEELNLKPAQMAVLWVRDQPAVVAPIIGPRTVQHLQEALAVMDRSLSPETMAALDELVPPGSVVSDFHNGANWMKMQVP